MTVTGAPPAATTALPPAPGPQATTTGPRGERTDVVVTLAQIAPRLGDVAANLERHLELIRDAQAGGAALVVFPELSLTGYFLKDLVPDVALREQSDELRRLAAASEAIDVVAGCVLEADDARFYNAGLYFSGGRIHHVHRKVYLPTYGLFDEARYLAQGDRFRSFAAPLRAAVQPRPWTAGLLVCEDMWHPTAVGLLARQGDRALHLPVGVAGTRRGPRPRARHRPQLRLDDAHLRPALHVLPAVLQPRRLRGRHQLLGRLARGRTRRPPARRPRRRRRVPGHAPHRPRRRPARAHRQPPAQR